MASDNEASCIADPNFAVICAFLQKFGTLCGLNSIDFIDLQRMIENTQEVPQPLANLHIKLLRRIKKSVPIERWERILSKVCHTYNNQDGWEIERFGYKKARISCKLRTLKTLLEMQFDCHSKFKAEVNKQTADELRSQPLGRDKLGHAYWYQIDEDCQIRVYKEDPDEETWMLVARDRDGLESLISQLKENDSIITGLDPVLNEDSNSLEIEKPILDTGQVDSTSSQSTNVDSKSDNNEEEDEKNDSKQPTVATETIEAPTTNGKTTEDIEETLDALPKPICLRLKPMSELLNSPSAAQYKADEDAKRKRNHEEPAETSKPPSKARKLILMNSKPVKAPNNKKRVEEFSEEDDEEEDDDDEEEDMEQDSDEVSEEIEEPVMYIKGKGSGKANRTGNIHQNSEEPSPIIGEEISEDVFFVFGKGNGAECETGNENQSQTNDKPSAQQTKKSIKLGMVIDSRTGRVSDSARRSPIKKNRWDVGKPTSEETVETPPKVSMFFFGPKTNTTAGISFFGATPSPSKVGNIEANVDELAVNSKEVSEQNHRPEEISTIKENVDVVQMPTAKVVDVPLTSSSTDNVISKDLSKDATPENQSLSQEDENSSSASNDNLMLNVEQMPKAKAIEIPITSSNTDNAISENLSKDDTPKNQTLTEDVEIQNSSPSNDNLVPKDLLKDEEEEKEGVDISSSTEELVKVIDDDQPKLETASLETVKENISSSACDISKEEEPTVIEENVETSPLIIDLSSRATSNTSSNTFDRDSVKDNNIPKSYNRAISEITSVNVCVNKELNTNINIENTKESTIDSNTIITEMEIEEALDVTDSNIQNRSGESMEIEEIDKGDADVIKSGDSMEIEDNDKADSSELNLGKLIEEAKRTHSFIDTSLPKKDKLLETSVSLENLPSDLSTVDDSKISMDIEDNSESTITTRNTTSESSTISEVTAKVSKEAEISESNIKEAVDLSGKAECLENNTDKGHKVETVRDRHFPIEEIKFSDSTDKKSGVAAVNVTAENHNASKDLQNHATRLSDDKEIDVSQLEQENIEEITKDTVKPLDLTEESVNKLISVEACVVPESETSLKNIEPPAIIVSASVDTTDNLTLAKEPECTKKMIAPLTEPETSAPDKTLTSVEACIISETETDLKKIEPPSIIVTTTVRKEQVCVKKNIAPLTDADVPATLDKPLDDKKAASPSMQSIESLESIDADCHASSIDRESEVDTAEDPFDNVGDPLGLAEDEQEDEIEEEEVEEEEEEGEVDPEALEEEEVEGEDDELGEEEVEDEEVDSEEEEEEEEIPTPVGKDAKNNTTKTTKILDKVATVKKATIPSSGEEEVDDEEVDSEEEEEEEEEEIPTPVLKDAKNTTKTTKTVNKVATDKKAIISSSDEEEVEDEEVDSEEEEEEEEIPTPVLKDAKNTTKTTKTIDKVPTDKKATISSFSMDFNDSSDSVKLPPMLKAKLKQRQLMQLKKQAGGDDSDDEDEESEDEEVDEEDDDGDDDNSSEDSDEEEEEVPPPKLMPKGKLLNLKQIRPPIKGHSKVPPPPVAKVQRPLPVQVKRSTTADLRKERKKKKSEIEILKEEISLKELPLSGVRQSRRIAQIKIREEAEKRKLEDLTLAQVKFESRKMFENSEKMKKVKLSSDEEYAATLDDLKKLKKKKKHMHPKFDEFNPWKSSSGSSTSQEEEQEEEIAEDSDNQELKSDHEFSPESDLEDDAEVKPVKRARTVRKEDKLGEDDEEVDDTPCEKCGKFDHPEWILLCDGCDHGWHCSCLRPALLVIPEGDWFCPPCQHVALLKKLEEQLVDLDKRRIKQQMEVRRKQRLAYVGISLNNVLATNDQDDKKDAKKSASSSSGSSGSTDSTDSDEPIYQLRQRRQAHSYRFNDYDDLINSAIQDEEDPGEVEAETADTVGNQGRGKDIATIVNAEMEQREKETGADTDKALGKKVVKRKKKRKLNSLVVSSGEDGTSDEDFRGSSSEEEDDLEFDEPLSSNSSYDSAIGRRRKKGGRSTRRSTRARWSRMDTDFIDDDSDLSDMPAAAKKKRKRGRWTSDSEDLDEEDELSELSDRSWGRKRKSGKRSSSKGRTKKSKTKKKHGSESDEPVQKKKRKIKFGGLNDSDEEEEKKLSKQDTARKTRGKKITYVDALGSDSEEEQRRRRAGIVEESEEEYVAEDDDGLEDEDGNEIEKDTDDSDSAVPKVHIKPVAKKGKGKGGIKRIKRAQGIEDELFPPLKPDEPTTEPAKPDAVTSTTTEDNTTPTTLVGVVLNTEPTTEKEEIVKPPEIEATDPMQEINRNIESMDEKLMMEDPDYATKQLQMVAAQLERKKKEDALSAAEAAEADEAAAESEDMAKHRRGRKPKVIPYMSPSPQIMQTKVQQEEDVQLENSSSPGPPALPAFGELSTTPDDDSPMKKRRGRGKGKKTLEKEAAAAAALAAAATALGKEDLGAPPNQDEVLPMPKPVLIAAGTASPSIDPAVMATAKLAIATPPQPFSQTEPAPSVITRMLQSPQAGSATPPEGQVSPSGAIPAPYGPGPPPHKYYGPGPPPPLIDGRPPPPGLRGGPHLPPGMPPHPMGGPPGSPYGLPPPPPMGGPMNHRPYQQGPLPPHMMRPPTASHSPPIPSGLYHHHHTVDASPSGGSAIQPMGGGSPGRIPPPPGVPHHPRTSVPPVVPPPHLSAVPPDRHSPLGHTPPPALIPPPGVIGSGPRYPPHSPGPPRQHHLHMVPPQHAMQHGIHGMAPRPPSGYPPGSYYSTYSPQPSGIPPEDYHHHHHPPLPPPHGYGLPPAVPPLAGDAIPPPGRPSVVEAGVGLKPTPLTDDSAQEDVGIVGAGPPTVATECQDSTGEFGGLVSYFSSQREDDLDG